MNPLQKMGSVKMVITGSEKVIIQSNDATDMAPPFRKCVGAMYLSPGTQRPLAPFNVALTSDQRRINVALTSDQRRSNVGLTSL